FTTDDNTVGLQSTAFALNPDSTPGNDGMNVAGTTMVTAVVGASTVIPDANAFKAHLQSITNQQSTGLNGNIEVIGNPGGPFTVLFKSNLSSTDAPPITGNITQLPGPVVIPAPAVTFNADGGTILSP